MMWRGSADSEPPRFGVLGPLEVRSAGTVLSLGPPKQRLLSRKITCATPLIARVTVSPPVQGPGRVVLRWVDGAAGSTKSRYMQSA